MMSLDFLLYGINNDVNIFDKTQVRVKECEMILLLKMPLKYQKSATNLY